MQDVIQVMNEEADDILLADVLARQDRLTDRINAIAELIYITRADYIGGLCLPWGMLTDGQRRMYRNEARALVLKGAQ